MRNPDVCEEALMIGSKYHMDEAEEVFGSGGFMARRRRNQHLPKFLRKHRDLHNFDPT